MNQEGFRLRPTALWFIFGPVLGCMWIAAVNYSNNLVYAVLYLIASLRVEHIRIHPAFAGDEVRMEIYLRNPTKRPIYGLYFERLGDEAGPWHRPTPLRTQGSAEVRIAAGDSCCAVTVLEKKLRVFKWGEFRNVPADVTMDKRRRLRLWEMFKTVNTPGSGERRGIFRFETLLIRTAYPFGLVWASVRVPVEATYYIYPQARGKAGWPEMPPSGAQASPVSQKPGDDFSGVRAYLTGESLRHIDWKAFARGRPLSIKQFTGGPSNPELWLDASEMGRMPLEARLSQLALWIVNAEKAGITYALTLGRTTLPPGLGPAHSRRALEALAVAGMGSA
jgi:uncharacterized protein (DUF58 family)